jgi:hypothetical protein
LLSTVAAGAAGLAGWTLLQAVNIEDMTRIENIFQRIGGQTSRICAAGKRISRFKLSMSVLMR